MTTKRLNRRPFASLLRYDIGVLSTAEFRSEIGG
jgi:hypothetical protein